MYEKEQHEQCPEIGAKRDFEHDGKGRRRAIIYVDGGEFHAYDLEAWHEEHHACDELQ